MGIVERRDYVKNPNRHKHDYYATPRIAVEELLAREAFLEHIYEPCVGGGHIAEVLAEKGHNIYGTDIADYRSVFLHQQINFFDVQESDLFADKHEFDVISNPPFKEAQAFIERTLNFKRVRKVAMLLRLQFLEGNGTKSGRAAGDFGRFGMFMKHPPKAVYVFSYRITCAMNGEFETRKQDNSVCYAWFVWEKDWEYETVIRWIGKER